MIKVDVEGYCQACLDFTPDVVKPQRIFAVGNGEPIDLTDTIIQCKYRKRCEAITRYLDRQMKGEVLG